MTTPVEFKLEWTKPVRETVMEGVKRATLPEVPQGSGWTYGCDRSYLESLRHYWLEEFSWDVSQATLNRYPQFIAAINGLDVHFVHVRGEGAAPRPLLLSHGWPGSHYEFWDVIEPLAFPSRFGGNEADAFDVVIPSLPGFGLSGKPPSPISQRATAFLWNLLMTRTLGYDRYFAQGGDWGGIVSSWLGLDHGRHVASIHLNLIAFQAALPPRTEAEVTWMAQASVAQQQLGGYSHLQRTKPQSLVWATAGNPFGQAAWIVERFHDWADLRMSSFEDVFSMPFLITNALLYVATGGFASAAWYYLGIDADGGLVLPPGKRCETPTAVSAFPGDALLPLPPRSRAEAAYNIIRWTDMPRGGHFAAKEEPDHFVADVRAWARDTGSLL